MAEICARREAGFSRFLQLVPGEGESQTTGKLCVLHFLYEGQLNFTFRFAMATHAQQVNTLLTKLLPETPGKEIGFDESDAERDRGHEGYGCTRKAYDQFTAKRGRPALSFGSGYGDWIAAGNVEQIFSAFFTSKSQGTGMGLQAVQLGDAAKGNLRIPLNRSSLRALLASSRLARLGRLRAPVAKCRISSFWQSR